MFLCLLASTLFYVCTSSTIITKEKPIIKPQNKISFTDCDPVNLAWEQKKFNMALGIDPTLTWKNASVLYNLVYAQLAAGPDAITKVCSARQHFAMELGASYESCISPWTLFSWNATSPTTPVEYSAIFNRLEFICGGAYQIALIHYPCVAQTNTSPAFVSCWLAFLSASNADPSSMNFCSALNTLMTCAQQAIISQGCPGEVTPWYMCESLRAGFGKTCPNLRCYL